jgi:hypothetical protein
LRQLGLRRSVELRNAEARGSHHRQVLGMAGHGAHAEKSNVYLSEHSRLGRSGPFWRRNTDVDSDRALAIALFIVSGTLGWSLFGTVLAFAPGEWVGPTLGVSSTIVFLQYLMWWRLGSQGALLSPVPIRQMCRILGIPEVVGLVLVYGSALWVLIAAVARKVHGGLPGAGSHSWVAVIGLTSGCIAFLALLALAIIDRSFGYEFVRPKDTSVRLRRALARTVPVVSRICFVSTTIAVFALTAQSLA